MLARHTNGHTPEAAKVNVQWPDANIWVPQVVKNKVAAPYKVSEFDILFGSGISTLGCLLDAAEKIDVCQRKGSWYYYGDTKLGQGRDKALQKLTDEPALAE